MLTLLLLSSSPVAFDPKIFLVVVLVVSGEENDASSSSWCRCASSRGGGRGAGRTIGRRPRLLHISMNAPQERNTANRTWPGLMRSMLSDIASFLFPSLSLSLSLSRAQSVCLMCVFMKIPLGRFGVHKSERIEREEGCCSSCCCCCSENKKRKCGALLWRNVLFFSSRYILF